MKRKVTTTKQGYLVIDGTGHPLAFGTKRTLGLHRIILWRKVGPGPQTCHWCGSPLVWAPTRTILHDGVRRCIADHLDGNRANNDPSNLVPACNPCNTLRSTPNVGRRCKQYVSQSTGRAIPFDAPILVGSQLGPARHVVRERTYDESGVTTAGPHLVSYELECGHTVKRGMRGKTLCFCAECAAS